MALRQKRILSRSRLKKLGFLLGSPMRTIFKLGELRAGDEIVLHPGLFGHVVYTVARVFEDGLTVIPRDKYHRVVAPRLPVALIMDDVRAWRRPERD